MVGLIFCFFTIFGKGYSDNQTPTVNPILPNSQLPFSISLEEASFSLPQGLQSYVYGVYKHKLLFLTGLNQGKHSFRTGQNTTAFVIDLKNGKEYSRSLLDPASGLSQLQIELLSVANAQGLQKKHTLYITGGYGIDTATGMFTTKNCLTAIDIKGMIDWVTHPQSSKQLAPHIRQIFDDTFKVAGGAMGEGKNGMVLLMFGADTEGSVSPTNNPIYTEQVRRFFIHDDGKELSACIKKPIPLNPNPNFRRRDLNIVPIIQKHCKKLRSAFVALSGVFTLSNGIWTVPVLIDHNGTPSMPDPNDPTTFKQGMNNYECATAELYSQTSDDMYVILFGGISYEYNQNGIFIQDPTFPFINQITTIKIDKQGIFNQYLMDAEFPLILSTDVNPSNPLYFGADAKFFPAVEIPRINDRILSLDSISHKKQVIGYIIGGIQNTVPDTTKPTDSSASSYIFKVFLKKEKD